MNSEGKIINSSDQSIDDVKRKSYKHNLKEEFDTENIEDESMEDLEDSEDYNDEMSDDENDDKLVTGLVAAEFISIIHDRFPENQDLQDLIDEISVALEDEGIEIILDGVDLSTDDIIDSDEDEPCEDCDEDEDYNEDEEDNEDMEEYKDEF